MNLIKTNQTTLEAGSLTALKVSGQRSTLMLQQEKKIRLLCNNEIT